MENIFCLKKKKNSFDGINNILKFQSENARFIRKREK